MASNQCRVWCRKVAITMNKFRISIRPVTIKDARFLHRPGVKNRRRTDKAKGRATVKKQQAANHIAAGRSCSWSKRTKSKSASSGATMIMIPSQQADTAKPSVCFVTISDSWFISGSLRSCRGIVMVMASSSWLNIVHPHLNRGRIRFAHSFFLFLRGGLRSMQLHTSERRVLNASIEAKWMSFWLEACPRNG